MSDSITPPPNDFEISKVTLYKNGIAYFERTGQAQKEQVVDLGFPLDSVNDVLKTITIVPVDSTSKTRFTHHLVYEVPPPFTTAPSSEPITQTRYTQSGLIQKLTGQTIDLVVGSDHVSGMLIAVDNSLDRQTLTIVKDDVLRTFPMQDITSVKISRNVLLQSKSMKVCITADAPVGLKISYTRACPIWKPTYRVVIEQGSPRLYGWATITNPGPEVWHDVQVSLVTGHPISFISEIYTPKYKKRKILKQAAHQVFPNLDALINNRDSDSDDDKKSTRAGRALSPPRYNNNLRRRDTSRAMMITDRRSRSREASRSDDSRESLSRSPSPASRKEQSTSTSTSTSASDYVDLFKYDLTTKITLPASHSALVPIVNQVLGGKTIALYRKDFHPEHPLSSLMLINNTDLILEEGPVTVFDGTMYLGEAHLQPTQPRERRFLPFAVDFAVNITKNDKVEGMAAINGHKPHFLKISRGLLSFSFKQSTPISYTIRNKSKTKEAAIILEHPKSTGKTMSIVSCFEKKSPDVPIEVKTEYVTVQYYGFSLTVPRNSEVTLVLRDDSVTTEAHNLNTSLNKFTVASWLDRNWITGKASEAMKLFLKAYDDRKAIDEAFLRDKDTRHNLETEQARIRNNLNVIQDKKVQERFVKQMLTIEDQLDALRAASEKADSQRPQLNKLVVDRGVEIEYEGLVE
eukprot:TRINITY_DN1721_c0_g1_i1.p1 TRINITY_DN1721_c0_g1~~TRINITY_DN1721_c0_g1_i1.p1  ORF type:complete len:689 (+),score=174.97 TRINITY_DN1721_c0_g1_i1:65-2131(+)